MLGFAFENLFVEPNSTVDVARRLPFPHRPQEVFHGLQHRPLRTKVLPGASGLAAIRQAPSHVPFPAKCRGQGNRSPFRPESGSQAAGEQVSTYTCVDEKGTALILFVRGNDCSSDMRANIARRGGRKRNDVNFRET